MGASGVSLWLLCAAAIAAAMAPTAAADHLGCNYTLFFNSSMQSLALRKFFNDTRGREQWPKQFAARWDTDEPCAWDGNERQRPPPAGTRCTSGPGHRFPPDGDGGVMGLEHYSGEAEGDVPREFMSFQTAGGIALPFNKLHGPLWDTSYHCSLLKLDLAHNAFTGGLPPDFMRRNRHAEIINLAHNGLSGPLPGAIAGLATLVVLLLDHNAFSGAVPDLSPLQSLRHLALGHNAFTGGVGAWLQRMHGLGWLELEHNALDGPLPPLPPNITRVNFAGNAFAGPVPESYGALGYLRHFNCTGCAITCPRDNLLEHLRYSSHCAGRKKFQ